MTGAALCTDIRIPVAGLSISAGEILAAITIAIAASRFRPTKSHIAFAGMALACALALASLIVDSGREVTATAVRNLLLPLLLLGALYHARLSAREAATCLSALVATAAACALLGLDQASRGSPPAFSLYSINGLASYKLREVMSWKLSLAQSHKLIPWQKALAYGMNLFSNNFAELLVYSLSAMLGLRVAGAISKVTSGLVVLLFCAALVAALSRTAWLGAGAVILTFGMIASRTALARTAWAATTVLAALAASAAAGIIVGFDRGGTVQGRVHLNEIAISAYTQGGPLGILFGGGGSRYWSTAGTASYPHSDALYVLLNFGAIGLIVLSALLLRIIYQLHRQIVRPTSSAARAFSISGFLAITWLGLYGLTWSTLASSNSTFLWCTIIGTALSVDLRERENIQLRAEARR